MHSFSPQKVYSLRADASAIGGYLETPVEKLIPTVAPVSLPPVGGFAIARSEAFSLDEIVSCSRAYTRVSGREGAEEGDSSILVTAVVEDLNILEVVRAARIVTQLTITLPVKAESIAVSVAGTVFEGLQIDGRAFTPKLDEKLRGRVTWEKVHQVGREQADALVSGYKSRGEDAHQWVLSRHRWMTAEPPRRDCGYAQASVLAGLEEVPGSHGHILEIPDFGRVILGELLISRDEVQLVGVRAELGCPTKGKISTNAGGGGVVRDN